MKKLADQRGSLLLISLGLTVIVVTLAFTLLSYSLSELRRAENFRKKVLATQTAEAGIDRLIRDLQVDLENSSGPFDGDINGYTVNLLPNTFVTFPYPDNQLNGGTYTVDLQPEPSAAHVFQIRSTGVIDGVPEILQVYVEIRRLSLWSNAVFAGSGSVKNTVINGNASIHGSVHILGNPDNGNRTQIALALNGTAGVFNNYSNIGSLLKSRIQPAATVDFHNENVRSLDAEVRVRHGQLNLSGTASLGQPHVSGNAVKETLDGVYVSDGFGGNQGSDNIYSDNGYQHAYDLGDTFDFPEVTAAYKDANGTTYPSYMDYLAQDALIVNNDLNNVTTSTQLSLSTPDGQNSLTIQDGRITAKGVIYSRGPITFSSGGDPDTFVYEGKASFVSEQAINIEANLLTVPAAGGPSFPKNIFGFMTNDSLTIGKTSQLNVMGLFYAENMISLDKQSRVAGTIGSNFFNMSGQVPHIFQVTATLDNLPPKLIGSEFLVIPRIIAWQRL